MDPSGALCLALRQFAESSLNSRSASLRLGDRDEYFKEIRRIDTNQVL